MFGSPESMPEMHLTVLPDPSVHVVVGSVSGLPPVPLVIPPMGVACGSEITLETNTGWSVAVQLRIEKSAN